MTSKIDQSYYLPPIRGQGIKRRNFLMLGSAFSASLLLPIAWKSHQLLTASNLDDQETEKLTANISSSVGFWQLDENLSIAEARTKMISANELDTGDSIFLQRGVRVKIHEIYLPDDLKLRSLSAYFHYQPAQLEKEVKVCAWCFQKEPVTSIAASTNLLVPIEEEGLKMSFDWENPIQEDKKPAIENVVLQLSVGSEKGTPKLQRGTYLIAGRSDRTGELPLWQQYEFRSGNIFRADRTKDKLISADFPYLIMSVDYGTTTPA